MSNGHIDDDGKHVADLDRRLRDLAGAYGDLGAQEDFDDLHLIIHGPGWTTLQDVFFMNVLIDSAERAAAHARQLRAALVEGARTIGEAVVAGQ